MSRSLPEEGSFAANPNLLRKVDQGGRFCPFYGDTVIFTVEDQIKDRMEQLQKELYRSCGPMLAEPLGRRTFHVTLHDLRNGADLKELEEQMGRGRREAEKILSQIREEERTSVRVRAVSVLNMVNTSVVLGLEPADEESCRLLMEWYDRFQEIVRLDYPLTLHLTLAYYRPGVYPDEQRRNLSRAFDALNWNLNLEFFLKTGCLQYHRFSHMNDF